MKSPCGSLFRFEKSVMITFIYVKRGIRHCFNAKFGLMDPYKLMKSVYTYENVLASIISLISKFSYVMNDILHPYLDSFFIVYLDDTLVYGAT